LIVDVLVNVSMGEEFEYFLLVLLDLVDHRQKEDKRNKERARCGYQKIQEYLNVRLPRVVRFAEDRLSRTVYCFEN